MSQVMTEPVPTTSAEPACRLELHTDASDIRVYEPHLVSELIVRGPPESPFALPFLRRNDVWLPPT